MKHSPAPWRHRGDCFDNGDIVDANDNHVVYELAENPADAALIAASPELLEALKMTREALMAICEPDGSISLGAVGKTPYNLREFIDSAIAKAEGNVPAKTETE